MTPFNVNDYVWVKLTERGRTLYRIHWEQYHCTPVPLETNAEGYSRFQLWDLMSIFGQNLYNGCEMPFETTILIDTPAETL